MIRKTTEKLSWNIKALAIGLFVIEDIRKLALCRLNRIKTEQATEKKHWYFV